MQNFVRRGIISVVYPERHSARVTFEDKDAVVSAELPILTAYASANNLYHLPEVGEQVICIFEENDSAEGDGVIIGSIYSDVNKPKADSQDICRLDFKDGSYLQFNRENGNLDIHCTGNITVNGKNIFLN